MYLSGLQLDKNFALLERLVDALILFGARTDLVPSLKKVVVLRLYSHGMIISREAEN